MTIRAVDSYDSNADLIVAVRELGHLHPDWKTLDCTYDKGVFWKKFRPRYLTASDIRPRSSKVEKVDFRMMPWADETFDAVVFDPPYGLRGTVNKTNGGYGLDAGYLSIDARHEMIKLGINETVRVLRVGGRLLVKCQDQVCSKQVRWQTRIFADHAEKLGCRLVERLDMLGGSRQQPDRKCWWCVGCDKKVAKNHGHGRSQPAPVLERRPSTQEHAYERPSTLLIFVKETPLSEVLADG